MEIFFTQKNLSKPEGLITLSFRSQTEYLEEQSLARTASPEKDKSYKDVKNWTVTFESETDNEKKFLKHRN